MQITLMKESVSSHIGAFLKKNFDVIMSTLVFLLLAGLNLDGFAHQHRLVGNTFFTPWHGIMYGMYFLCLLMLGGYTIVTYSKNKRWNGAIPAGYEWAFYGLFLFMLGGCLDFLWHTAFGFENGTEPLVSPTHLLLAISGIMIIAGPLRATLKKLEKGEAISSYCLLMPTITLLGIVSFFTGYANMLFHPELLADKGGANMGLASVMLPSFFLMGALLFLFRYEKLLPSYTVTLLLFMNVIGGVIISGFVLLLLPILVTGMSGDLLRFVLKPSYKRFGFLQMFMSIIVFLLYFSFFTTMMMIKIKFGWSVNLWLGGCFLASGVSWLLTLVIPSCARS